MSGGKHFPTIDSGASKTSPAICPAAKAEDQFFHSERPVTNLAWNERFGNGSRYGLRKVTRCRVPSKAATLWDVSNSDSELKLSYTATRNSRDYNLPAVAKKWISGRHAGGFDNILFVDGHAACFNNRQAGGSCIFSVFRVHARFGEHQYPPPAALRTDSIFMFQPVLAGREAEVPVEGGCEKRSALITALKSDLIDQKIGCAQKKGRVFQTHGTENFGKRTA